MEFKNREEAGKKLSTLLSQYKGSQTIVYGIPRGGVVPAKEIAKALGAPLDLIIVRKIGHPYSEEYALGAIAEDGDTVFDELELQEIKDSHKDWLQSEMHKEQLEAQRRREWYLQGIKPVSAEGKTALLVDDGVATGLTIKVAIRELRHKNPKEIIIAVPVAPKEFVEEMKKEHLKVISLSVPEMYLGSVGAYYEEFPQLSDSDVQTLMKKVS